MKLVSSFDWIDFSALSEVPEIISRVLSDTRAAEYLDERRVDAICGLAEKRIQYLESLARIGK